MVMELEKGTIILVPQTDDDCTKLIELKLKLPENYFTELHKSNRDQITRTNIRTLESISYTQDEEIHKDKTETMTNCYDSSSEFTCLICNEKINPRTGDSLLNIFKEDNFTRFTKTNLWIILSEIFQKEICKDYIHSEFICIPCFELINEWDDFTSRLKTIRSVLTNTFFETCEKLKAEQKIQDLRMISEKKRGEVNETMTMDGDAINFKIRTKCRKIRLKGEGKKNCLESRESSSNTKSLHAKEPSSDHAFSEEENILEGTPPPYIRDKEKALPEDERLDATLKTTINTNLKPVGKEMARVVTNKKDQNAKSLQLSLKVKYHQCSYCNSEFKSASECRTHLKSHSGTCECKICGKLISKGGMLLQHQKKFHGLKIVSQSRFSCWVCGKTYQSKSALSYHFNSIHSYNRFKCEFCDKTFQHFRNLSAHKLRHGTKAKKCSYCEATFYTTSELGYHINGVHIKAKCWQCNACGKQFSRCSSYNKHLLVHESNRFECVVCRTNFNKKSKCLQHTKNSHG